MSLKPGRRGLWGSRWSLRGREPPNVTHGRSSEIAVRPPFARMNVSIAAAPVRLFPKTCPWTIKTHPKLKLHVRVEPVAERVAHQVDRERRQKDREPRERRDPPGVQHVHAALAEHVAPRRRRRLHAEPEEGQERLEDDHLGHLEGRDDDDGGHEVRQDLAEDDPRVAHPERPARQNRSEEHTSELRHGYISYAVFCLKKK